MTIFFRPPIRSQIFYQLLCCCLPFGIMAQVVDYEWYNKGLGQKKVGAYQQAHQSFAQFIQQYPHQEPQAYFHRGYSSYYLKNYQAAIDDFKELYRLNPNNVDGPYALGRTFYQLEKYTESIDYFSLAIQVDPSYAAAYNDRGMVRCLQQNYESALEDFYKATSIDTSFAMAYNNTGTARYFNQDIAKPNRKDLQIAHEWFSKAIEQDRTLALAYRNRATMNIFLKRPEAALMDLNQASRIEPENGMVYFYFGVVYADQNKNKKAIASFTKALEFNPQLSFAFEEMGNLYKDQQQETKAIEQYKLAQTARPNTGKLYQGLMAYRMALVYAEMGQKDQMLQVLKKGRKAKVFSDMRVYQDFLKAKEFKNFRDKRAFKRFTRSVRKGKKDNKFLHPELAWFRMRK